MQRLFLLLSLIDAVAPGVNQR